MKNIILFIFLFLSSVMAADFDWLHSINKAKEEALKNNKKILLMISRDGCRSCEYMDSVVFENEDVVEYVENFFIPVKLDLEKANKNGFKAFATPTFYFLNKNLKTIKRVVGAATPNTFLKTLRELNSN